MHTFDTMLSQNHLIGVRGIEIVSLPAAVSPRFFLDVVSSCLFQQVSLELCVRNAGEGIRLFLLLRAQNTSKGELGTLLDGAAGQLAAMLRQAGFAVLMMDAAHPQWPILRPAASTVGAVYHAPEEDRRPFVPVNCMKLRALDAAALLRALSGHASWSLSLVHTCAHMTENEIKIIDEYIQYFSSGAAEDSSDALSVYQQLRALSAHPMFLTSVFYHGSTDALHDLDIVMDRFGMVRSTMPQAFLRSMDEPAAYPLQLAAFAASSCHTTRVPLRAELRRLSFLLSKEHASALLYLPADCRQLPGLTVHALPIDSAPLPAPLADSSGLHLGCRFGTADEVHLPLKFLPKHGIIVGMPGSGKTTFALGLMHQLQQKQQKLPFLIIEPTKTDYRALIDQFPDLRVYTPGRSDLCPMMLNPFLPPRGVTLEQYMPNLTNAFVAAFSMTSPLDVIFPAVVKFCYTRYGWRANSTRDSVGARVFGMHEFICAYREYVRSSTYSAESKANLEGGGIARLNALLHANATLFDTDRTLPYEELLTHPTLIELDAIDNQEQKALIMALLLNNLMLVIRKNQAQDGCVKNVIMIDEAHLLLGTPPVGGGEDHAQASTVTVQMLQNWIVTIRAYGTGLLFADQSPRKLTSEIVDNSDTKVIFHLDSDQDRAMLASSTGMPPETASAIQTLNSGQAIVCGSAFPRPIHLVTPNVRSQLRLRSSVPDEDVRAHMQALVPQDTPFSACDDHLLCRKGCSTACRMEAEYLSSVLLDQMKTAAGHQDAELADTPALDSLIQAVIEEQSRFTGDLKRLAACVKLQFFRAWRRAGMSIADE